MNLLFILLMLAMMALAAYAYFLLAKIAFAIWFPERVSGKWNNIKEFPPVKFLLPFFKYVVPLALIVIAVSLVVSVGNLLLLNISR